MGEIDTNAISKRGMSLRLKLTIGLILIIGILFAGTNTFNLLQSRQRQRDEALAHNETISFLIAGALIPELGSNDIESDSFRRFASNFLNAALKLSKKNRDLAFVVVVDNIGRVIAGSAKTDITLFEGTKRAPNEAAAVSQIAALDGKLGGDMRAIRFPLVVSGKGNIGRLYVGTSLVRILREARQDLIINISILVTTLLVLIAYASLTLGRMVISPITKVVSAMRAVQQGDLEQQLNLKRRDEIGVLADTYNFMVTGLKDREQLKDAFSRYVSPQVYERFKSGSINLRGEMRRATVLFSDIRSFTTLSEQLTPVEVVTMLNEYFTEMVEIVFRYDGFVNKLSATPSWPSTTSRSSRTNPRCAPCAPRSKWSRRSTRSTNGASPAASSPSKSASASTPAPSLPETSATSAASSTRSSATR